MADRATSDRADTGLASACLPGSPALMAMTRNFFRLEDGKVVERWDVIQEVPKHAANPNGMF